MRCTLPVRAFAAIAVAVAAFVLYDSTLLPGFDFGDTPSFQVMAGSPIISPRDGYPLYFAVARIFAWFSPDDPARALNLASAVEGAVACGLLMLVALELSGSLVASVAAAAVFGGSYSFWSQNVIAEVYALHLCFVSATMLLLLWWERRPTRLRLGWFFAIYALGFGNHLLMILLLPACALFLLVRAPAGWRSMFSPRVVVPALACAALGAAQYLWNFHALWRAAQPPRGLLDAFRTFWFDVTKSDWRDTMVLRVPAAMLGERLQMYAFELRQQFGWVFPLAAAAGLFALVRRNGARAGLLGAAYGAGLLFALGYNVGDSHVFFLPPHLVIAMLIAPGLAAADRLARSRGAVALLALMLAGVQVYANYPALDRSADYRPLRVLSGLTANGGDQRAIVLTDLNWQIQNGLTYFAKYTRPDVAFARMPDVLLYAPALLRDNAAIGRAVFLSERARSELEASYGPLVSAEPDSSSRTPTLGEAVGDLEPGTRYVLCVLRPTREFTIAQDDLAYGLDILTGGTRTQTPDAEYVAIAGLVGEQPASVLSGNRPFRTTTRLGGVKVEIRMESWLAFDTIRRMGFGQVVAAHHHTLIVERGISFAAFDESGAALRTSYHTNIFAAQPRYVVTQP